MDKRFFFYYALFTSSFLSFPLSAECIPSPDCAALGYDKTSCPSGDSVLKCPFDSTKMKCIPLTCEAIGKKTCGENCVPSNFTGCCSDSDCAAGYFCSSDNYLCREKSVCGIGYIYYSDKTCSSDLISGKTPIGIVAHTTDDKTAGIVVALDSAYDAQTSAFIPWGCANTDLSLPNMATITEAKTDFDGKNNTDVIAAQCGSGTAAYYCKNVYAKAGIKGWYLPAFGELRAIMYENYETINPSLQKISSNYQISTGYWYWSSTENSATDAMEYASGTGNRRNYDKNTGQFVRCVLAF